MDLCYLALSTADTRISGMRPHLDISWTTPEAATTCFRKDSGRSSQRDNFVLLWAAASLRNYHVRYFQLSRHCSLTRQS